MKQGRASSSKVTSTKVEPKAHAINPGAVSRMGIEPGPFTKPKQLYEGRGLEAPMVGTTSHKAGSQGKH
jgi:hypothetical protein